MPEQFVQTPDPVPFERLTEWRYHPNDIPSDEVWTDKHEWSEGGRTFIWDDDVRCVWFRQEWTVPDAWAGRALMLMIEIRTGLTVYVDGHQISARHLLTPRAEAGRAYRLSLRGDRHRRPGMIMRSEIHAFPAEYAKWLDAQSVAAALAPSRGLLLDDWRARAEVHGENFADPHLDHSEWQQCKLGDQWHERDSCHWYRAKVSIPPEIGGFSLAGEPLRLTASFNHEGSIWVDGEKRAEYARDFGHAVVAESTEPGNAHLFALRVPTPWCGWLRDTYLVPESLAQANEAFIRLSKELDYWNRFFRVRPEEEFLTPVADALLKLKGRQLAGPALGAATDAAAEALGNLRRKYADDAPFAALPYLQLPSANGVIVRAESPVVRPAVLALLDDDGDTILLSDEGETRFHRFELSGLQPDTQYSYTVAAGNVTSEICVFSTAPVEPRSITVVAWGDSHYGPTVLEGIAERINEIRPDLLVTAGDMVGDGIHENEWADYVFQPLRHLRGGYAMHFPVGNHDHGSWRHHERGDNPYLNERWEPSGTEWGSTPYGYSFDYAGVHFVFVDPLHGCTGNEKFLGLNKGTAQYDWLERDLAASRGARWTILHVHEPPFCETWEGGYYDGQPELREHLVPLMEKYGVDICISGHAHTYERGLPHPPYNPATGEGNTVAYLVTGGGGSHLDNRKFREWPQIDIPPHRLEQTEDYLSNDHGEFYRYHFCTLRIEHERLECTAYWIRLDGTVVDTMDWFVLRKGIPRRS